MLNFINEFDNKCYKFLLGGYMNSWYNLFYIFVCSLCYKKCYCKFEKNKKKMIYVICLWLLILVIY